MVVSVRDDLTLLLEDGGEMRLAAINVPPAFAEAAWAVMVEHAVGQQIVPFFAETRADRWRRVVAHAVSREGIWLQGTLVEQGLARVQSFSDNRTGVRDLLVLEARARGAGLGLWADWRTQVKTVDETPRLLHGFHVVEGQVIEAANVRGRVYLNFGDDWKTDFTILVPPKVRRQFERENRELISLEGINIRVRGWVKDWNGPMIELTHAEQLEIIDAPVAP
ncbi:MAG: thermonuclease family protein [Alphaproteobacteria bacterium]